jgi:hypothetical protein
VALAGRVVGVAILGRTKARLLDDGWTCEVTRCCTDGTLNANSKLYSQCWLIARALGYRRMLTYTLPEESGASLRALKDLGFRVVSEKAGGGSWNCPSRPRMDEHPTQSKIRWEIECEA